MKQLLDRFSLLLTIVILAGCGKSPAPAAPDPLLAVVRAQADALNRKDLDATMNALDPASPGYAQVKDMTAKIFQTYDLRYTLSDLRVESVNNDEAHVHFVQLTEKVSGPAFRNNRVEGTHTLLKRNGVWRIANTQAAKVDYLDK